MTSRSRSTSSDGPAPRPSSPSGSFYAMSDDEEGDYDTITHTESGRGVKLLFSKSKVSASSVRACTRHREYLACKRD